MGVAGLLTPGTYVDVLVVIAPANEQIEADRVADTVMQGVRVLAIDDRVAHGRGGVVDDETDGEEDTRGRRRDVVVTLEVEPAEAEGLALASSRGDILLSLRAEGELDVVDNAGPLVTNALIGVPAPVKTAQERRIVRRRKVEQRQEELILEVIRGG